MSRYGESGLETTADEVCDLFGGDTRARSAHDAWRRRPGCAHVVDHVMAHRTRVPYRLRRDDILDVCHKSSHALGTIRKEHIATVTAIADWRPDFAMTHTLHHALEVHGRAFTWQWFHWFLLNDPRGREMLDGPARTTVHRMIDSGVEERTAFDALGWRIGNAYYSFMRELYTVVSLRERGLDVRLHPLADALFRADAWLHDRPAVLLLYIGNGRYRDGADGRKPHPESLLGRGFGYSSVNLPVSADYGKIHLPTDEQLDAGAAELRTPSP